MDGNTAYKHIRGSLSHDNIMKCVLVFWYIVMSFNVYGQRDLKFGGGVSLYVSDASDFSILNLLSK